ncbi:MAG TPA: oligopeptide transporter, OPT family [Polyangiaceae bacterium]|jgi:putative OPT family oligopeptide transporter|nr:MAG: OPT oligopeptide transporter protein [Deltaproteobacteria bacterium ADurb.Bin207]HNZ24290.1 oligopeptide transporter, OPT family [Polyangiaceae bacterium]HOD24250.1 oligopeptide transporter, OPT family [Polyangiaceae bacterium]HOE50841.1 oligopeptide transporter, OPT family [Polyangiaceae bacterium]HOH02351.1 oligopeptide transporter, OPT family [Polyangiaceae bacterium]
MQAPTKKVLPENAYRKLEPGEVYEPIVPHDDNRAEVTVWSLSLGVVMVALFAAAGIYMALRAGNAIETAIPIAIMAVFFGKLNRVRSTILENVMVQSIGQASGVVAAGAAFVIPALYINQLQPSFWHIFFATAIGGFLGVVLIIPLRKYFVADQHGELPFPEATATNEILVSAESPKTAEDTFRTTSEDKPKGNAAGKVLIISFLLGGLYDFLVEAVHAWNPMVKTSTLLGGLGRRLHDQFRFEISLNAIAALFGLGYIIGLRYAAIIAAGSVLAYLVLVPLIYLVGAQLPEFQYIGETYKIAEMSGAQIFAQFVKPIGIGAIAVSGIIGMIRMGKIILGSLSLGLKGLKSKSDDSEKVKRTDRDMNPRTVMLIQLGTTLLMGGLFFVVAWQKGDFGIGAAAGYAALGMIVAFVLSFLFTPVAAQAIAIVGVNPVSGMTLITLVIASGAMAASGLAGPAGMFIALIIGTAVCTALSTSGALVSDFKIGYWIGSTPANQQKWKFLGIIVASLTVAIVVPAMDSAYHFLVADEAGRMVSNQEVLPAPQANMLAVIVKGLMSDAQQPYLLYALGGVVAIMLYMAGVPMLAFALGMYLPIFINVPVLFGAFVAWLIGQTGGSKKVREARTSQGILIASGLMAGAAIFGIVTAVLRLDFTGYAIRYLSIGEIFHVETKLIDGTKQTLLKSEAAAWYDTILGQGLGYGAYIILALACYFLARWGAEKELASSAPDTSDESRDQASS